MIFKHSIVLGVTAPLLANTALVDVKISFIGDLSSDTGPNALRGAEIVIKETSAAGGTNGERLVLVNADAGEDITEGVKAYEHLAETEGADSIISGSIDDAGPGWLPRMQKFRTPTLDTWAFYISIIDTVIGDPETMASYFMNIVSNEALATLYINFSADMLKKETGWDSIIILAEDTAFGEAITGLVAEALGPVAGIETEGTIIYDVGTVDFALLFSKARASGVGFIYQISSANLQVISSRYVKLRVPMTMASVGVSALGLEYWEDTGGAGSGIPILLPIPSVGFELGPESQKFVDTYQTKYDNHPKTPHFNGFNACWGLKQAVAAAEATGGFGDAKAWPAEMKKQDIMPRKDGKMRLCYAFWDDNGAKEVTGRTYPYNARSNLAAPYDDTQPFMVVIQWKEDGKIGMVYPPEYVTTKFIVPGWVK